MTAIKRNELPDDVYIPFVETLFRDGFTLAIGISAQTALMCIVGAKTGNPSYLVLAAVLVLVGIVRVMNMRRFAALPPIETRQEAYRRETRYIIYGAMHGLVLGTFCLTAIYTAQDEFAEIAAVCIVLATATGIAGRNYGSPRMVNILILTLACPMALGFILRGDFYHVALGLLSAPFLLAIHRYADTVRDVLFTAISAESSPTGWLSVSTGRSTPCRTGSSCWTRTERLWWRTPRRPVCSRSIRLTICWDVRSIRF